MGPVSGEEKKKRILARIDQERKQNVKKTLDKDPNEYLLSAEEMCLNDYPMPSYVSDVSQLRDDWVESPQVDTVDDASKSRLNVFALDCEMVSYTIERR